MSHHFDTKLAKEDPNLNVCDVYLLEGTPAKTMMTARDSAEPLRFMNALKNCSERLRCVA